MRDFADQAPKIPQLNSRSGQAGTRTWGAPEAPELLKQLAVASIREGVLWQPAIMTVPSSLLRLPSRPSPSFAMHFNDLLMRLRSQSLAAVGGLASVAGYAFKGDSGATITNWHALFAAFSALCVF
jgi:hypothetical protein